MISFIKRYSGFFLLLAGIVGLIVLNLTQKTGPTVLAATTLSTETMTVSSAPDYLVVDVKGEVYFPGCYRVPNGSRIGDAIDAAGGTKIQADLSQINRSALLADEMVVYVPSRIAESDVQEETAEWIWVDVKGSVAFPECYRLPAGSRVADALAAAGGVSEEADLSGVNLSAILTDAMVVFVPSQSENDDPQTVSPVPGYGYVAIKGEVLHPGLYVISTDSTLEDLINLAGGLTLNGSVGNLDLTEIIVPGSTIQVLSESAVYALLHPVVPSQEETGGTEAENPSLIDINTASADELDTLYGIGPVLAQAIIDYRAENGEFECIEDIMKVPGIKTTVYESIKDDIRV